MKYTIWDKVTSIYGLDAETILNADEALKYDDVIIITDKFGEIIYLDTKKALARRYEIESTDPHEVAKGVINKLIHPEKIEFVEVRRDKQDGSIIKNSKDNVIEYDFTSPTVSKQIDDITKNVLEYMKDITDQSIYDFNEELEEDDYKEPECKITKIDISDNIHKDESIELILENVTFEMKDGRLPDYRLLKEAYPDEHDLKVIRNKIKEVDCVNISMSVVEVYEYKNYILAKTKTSQNIFIDKNIVDKCHTNITEYDRRLGDIGKQRVKYVTVHVHCDEGNADLFERGNSVFIIL